MMMIIMFITIGNIGERLKLEGETENMGVWTKKRRGMTAVVLMATPCTKSLGGGNGGHMLMLMMLERETMVCVKKTAMRHKRGE